MTENTVLFLLGMFLVIGIVSFALQQWWEGGNKKPAGPREKGSEKPEIQEQPPKPEKPEIKEQPPKPPKPEKPEIKEQPPGPPEPPEEPRRRSRPWEIKAERAQQFAVYEVACLLAGTAPAWPLPTPESKEEYELLRLALLDDELGGELAYEAGFAEGDGGDDSRLYRVELERRHLRAYLRARDREDPEFLDERFDKRPRQYAPFKHQ